MQNCFERVSKGTWAFWATLMVPLVWLSYEFFIQRSGGEKLFYWSGAFSVWLILATLAVTPTTRLIGGGIWKRRLIVGRRHMGVASVGYGVLHTVYWLQKNSVHDIIYLALRPDILVGWISLAILAAMAATSNDWSVRRMGHVWKKLQRWIYFAAPLVLLHWLMASGYHLEKVIVYVAILTVLLGYRMWQRQVRRRMSSGN